VGKSNFTIHEQYLVARFRYEMQLKSVQYLKFYPIAATNIVLLTRELHLLRIPYIIPFCVT